MDKRSQIEFFDQIAGEWDSVFPCNESKLRCLTELCELKEGARILDAACGTGTMEAFLLEKKPSYVLGVDFSPNMIEIAKSKCKDSRIELRCCDVMELSDAVFDCAIVLGAFSYFENRGSLIRQLHCLLATGGRMMICHVPGHSDMTAHYGAAAAQLSMPLPAAKILTNSLEPFFDIDTIIDTPELYVVSGVKKLL
ncbi:class I SAM-dependent methyltransferase [Oscillospiraceae bacterium PP1C4]